MTKQLKPSTRVESTESSRIIANVDPGKEAPLEADYEEVMRAINDSLQRWTREKKRFRESDFRGWV